MQYLQTQLNLQAEAQTITATILTFRLIQISLVVLVLKVATFIVSHPARNTPIILFGVTEFLFAVQIKIALIKD
jgi:hypothetical protein